MNEASYARTMPNSVFPLLASMVLVLAQTSLVGCAPGASRAQVARSPESLTPHALDRADAKLPVEDLLVEISPDPRRANVAMRVVVKNGPRHFTIADARGTTVSELSARDGSGPLEVDAAPSPTGSWVLTPTRASVGPVELRYRVAAANDARPSGAACPFIVEPDRAIVCGEAVFAAPEDGGAARTLRLILHADHEFHADAASSLGLADDLATQARPDDVTHAAFVFGDLGTSELHAGEAHDHAAWLGYTSFDPRWVAAESAGVRTSIDRWLDVRRPKTDYSVGLLLVSAPTAEHPLDLERRTHGVFVTADLSTSWTPVARIRIAQLFAQRTIGGALWIGDRSPPSEASGAWFSDGIARALAVDVLREMEVLTPDEHAAELNSLLVEEALGQAGDVGIDELGALATGSDASARESALRALSVRGALLGARLGQERLRKVLRALVTRAGEAHLDTLPIAAFLEAVETAGGAELAKETERVLTHGGDMALPKNALGSCYDLTKKTVVPFELGFGFAEGEGGKRVIDHVDAGSAAARAGVATGDALVVLAYQPGRPDIAVELKVHREGGDRAIRFLPAGKGRPGRAFVKSHETRCRD